MTEADSAPLSENDREELLALYQVTAQGLIYFKSQQWSVTNYSLAIYAAVVAIPQFVGKELSEFESYFFMALLVVAAAYSTLTLWRLHSSIVERQSRLDRVYALLGSHFRSARGEKSKVRPHEMGLIFLNFIAFGLLVWLWVFLK